MKTRHPIRFLGLAAAMFLPAIPSHAVDPITLPSSPLYLAGGVAPNLVVTLDDSGSMARAYVPESMASNAKDADNCDQWNEAGSSTKRFFTSGDYNASYYNPKIQYLAPVTANGTSLATTFGVAYRNGFYPSAGSVDLGSKYRPTYYYIPKSESPSHCYAAHPAVDIGLFGDEKSEVAAYYYRYEPGTGTCTEAADISKTNEDCYIYTKVTGTSGPGGTDERQNFANWYSFYRTRNLATVSAATRAFTKLPNTLRLAWQALSSCNSFSSTTCKGWDDTDIKAHLIKTLSSDHKQDFYKWLEKLPANGATPLRAALGRVGEYFSTDGGTNNPYAEEPQFKEGTEHSCRANYTIMMTDGIWNGSGAVNVSDNVDNTTKSLPDGISYSPSPPFSDNNSDSLADVSFYYWATDLRDDLTDNVPRNPRSLDKTVEDGQKLVPPKNPPASAIDKADYLNPRNDPASWQHMVTYTVGLGLTTTFPTLDPALTWAGDTYTGSYDQLASGDLKWPKTGSADDKVCYDVIGGKKVYKDCPGNVADLWHAALNGRGLFFSAEDPASLSNAMQEMVNSIISRESSAASIASNSKRLDVGTTVYQASYDSGHWTGELAAFEVTWDGKLGDSQWKATEEMPAAKDRNIKTFNGTNGVDFKDDVDISLGLTTDVVNYLRGEQTKEQSECDTCPFRTRTSVLGDIINSDPLFVSEENFGYDKLAGSEGTSYISYVIAKKKKAALVYVGANDGMLHAFDASVIWKDDFPTVDTDGDGVTNNDPDSATPSPDNGKEVFAYVPKLLHASLVELTKPSYAHKFYVDGAPAMGDVFYGSATWKTVLVTTLGAGGRGVFALDVSKDFSQTAFDVDDVLWEFDGTSSESSPNDMGYPVGSASIGRFQDNKYYAVFGNGYGSANCQAGLFLVQIDAPTHVEYISTGVGACSEADASDQNGMSTPSLVDYDGDRIIDAIFAGDLQGNLWKFDVSATASSSWGIAHSGQPVFTTPAGQPITAPVEVGHAPIDAPAEAKAMVYFGTGSYLFSGDESDKTKQTFYGLLDEDDVVTKLQQQTIVYEDANARVVSTNTVNWASEQGWYLDLVPPSDTLQGERVLSVPLLRYGRVIFNTSIPSADPCVLGGTGWLMELDAATGGNLSYNALDMNGDGNIDAKDYVLYKDKEKDVTSAAAGKKTDSMSLNQPTVIRGGEKEYKFNSDIKKGISVITEKSGTSNPRSSWRQLQ